MYQRKLKKMKTNDTLIVCGSLNDKTFTFQVYKKSLLKEYQDDFIGLGMKQLESALKRKVKEDK